MIGNWHKFLIDTQNVVFVVDLGNQAQISAAHVEFEFLFSDPSVKNKGILLVLNKVDLASESD